MTEGNGVSAVNPPGKPGMRTLPAGLQSLRRDFWLDLFAARGPGGLGLPLRAVLVDWAILAVVVFAFCTAFFSLDDARALPGNEADIVQALDWTLVNSLNQFAQFPLWNPYLRTGMPYVADPFLHVYNPLATLPVLMLGVWDGFKVALFLSFLAAALGSPSQRGPRASGWD
jgi:hypothetical protein